MNFSFGHIFADIVLSIVGLFFLKSGKDRGQVPLIFVGIAMMLSCYFIENVFVLWGVGLVLGWVGFRL